MFVFSPNKGILRCLVGLLPSVWRISRYLCSDHWFSWKVSGPIMYQYILLLDNTYTYTIPYHTHRIFLFTGSHSFSSFQLLSQDHDMAKRCWKCNPQRNQYLSPTILIQHDEIFYQCEFKSNRLVIWRFNWRWNDDITSYAIGEIVHYICVIEEIK